MSAVLRIVCGVMLLAGCSTLNFSERYAAKVRASLAGEIKEFANLRTTEELDRRLHSLREFDDAQLRFELLIEGWGKHGSWYDLAVVKFFADQFPSAYGNDRRDSELFNMERLFNVTNKVLREHPEFVVQIFWYEQWKSGSDGFARLMQRIEPPSMRGCVRLKGEEYASALWLAGIVEGLPFERQPGALILQVRWDHLIPDEVCLRQTILSQRPFLRFDSEKGRFVVDQEAKRANRYLTADEQQTSPRPTPLPNWDSEIIPPRPVHEPESDQDVELLGIPD